MFAVINYFDILCYNIGISIPNIYMAKELEIVMVIIINGAPGAGKTFLLKSLYKFDDYKFVPVKKYTTRYPRNFEKGTVSIDLRYGYDKQFIDNLEYHYDVNGKSYGIDKNEIQGMVDRNEIPVIIIRSFDIIKRIKDDFDNVCVFFIIGATGDTLQKRLIQQGRAQKDILVADSVFRSITNDYINHFSVIDHCIINSLYDQDIYFKQFLAFVQTQIC